MEQCHQQNIDFAPFISVISGFDRTRKKIVFFIDVKVRLAECITYTDTCLSDAAAPGKNLCRLHSGM